MRIYADFRSFDLMGFLAQIVPANASSGGNPHLNLELMQLPDSCICSKTRTDYSLYAEHDKTKAIQSGISALQLLDPALGQAMDAAAPYKIAVLQPSSDGKSSIYRPLDSIAFETSDDTAQIAEATPDWEDKELLKTIPGQVIVIAGPGEALAIDWDRLNQPGWVDQFYRRQAVSAQVTEAGVSASVLDESSVKLNAELDIRMGVAFVAVDGPVDPDAKVEINIQPGLLPGRPKAQPLSEKPAIDLDRIEKLLRQLGWRPPNELRASFSMEARHREVFEFSSIRDRLVSVKASIQNDLKLALLAHTNRPLAPAFRMLGW